MAPRNNTTATASGEGSQAAGRDLINNTTNNNVVASSVIVFDPQKLADIINALNASMLNNIADAIDDFTVLDIAEKNELNGISDTFYDECIKEHYEFFSEIAKFFKDPINKKYVAKLRHILTEVKAKIITKQNAGESMESILATLFDFAKTGNNINLFNENSYMADILASYLYAHCFIGRKTK